MKALSVLQPWAWLIKKGHKTIETRTWPTAYRGDILIVSSKKPIDKVCLKVFEEKFGPIFDMGQYGLALCIVNLIVCRPMTKADEKSACCPIYDGAYSWMLSNLRVIQPFSVKGKLGIYDIEVPKIYESGRMKK